MKRALFWLLPIGCVGQQPSGQLANCGISDTTQVTSDGVGELRLGRSVADVSAKCNVVRDTTELGEEAQPVRVVTVVVAGDTLSAVIDSGRVWRIHVTRAGLQTADSLGVGTTLARLLAEGDATGIEGESGLFVTLTRKCGVSFRIGHSIALDMHRSEWDIEHLRSLPPDSRVDLVLLYGCSGRAPSR